MPVNNEGSSKQRVLDEVCSLLGLNPALVSRGSSIPSEIFREAASQIGVPYGSMPQINESIIRRARLPYSQAYDSRATPSRGGSTVTLEGLEALRDALEVLLR